MGFNRTSRAGQTVTLPALCCPTYQRRISDAIAGAALRGAEGLTDEQAISEAMNAAAHAAVEALSAERVRFAEHLDPAVLTTSLDDVARVTIRGLSGAQLADAETAGRLACSKTRSKDPSSFIEAEVIRAGLVAVDGFDESPGVNGYPIEALYQPGGMAEWAAFRVEVAGRIRTWSTLGESALSSSAP